MVGTSGINFKNLELFGGEVFPYLVVSSGVTTFT